MAVSKAQIAARLGLDPAAIVPMPAKGVAHDHYRIAGRGLVVRVPRDLPWAAPPERHLAYEATCFERAEASGITPRLEKVLDVGSDLPRGALVVEEVSGRPVKLPQDLEAIARALARLHAVPMPLPAARSPLPDHGIEQPSVATLALISQHAAFLDSADAPAETKAALREEMEWARGWTAKLPGTEPLALVGSDTHPGNFIIQNDGSARFVDLERVLYGSPAIDLAHASLPTSLSWDRSVTGTADLPAIADFYRRYIEAIGPTAAEAIRPWLLPARRLTWLRTMMWFVRWRSISAGGDVRIDEDLAAHIHDRISSFLAPPKVVAMRDEWLGASHPPKFVLDLF